MISLAKKSLAGYSARVQAAQTVVAARAGLVEIQVHQLGARVKNAAGPVERTVLASTGGVLIGFCLTALGGGKSDAKSNANAQSSRDRRPEKSVEQESNSADVGHSSARANDHLSDGRGLAETLLPAVSTLLTSMVSRAVFSAYVQPAIDRYGIGPEHGQSVATAGSEAARATAEKAQ